MKQYQKQAVKLASEILSGMNKPKFRVCPVCHKPTTEIDNGTGDKYGHVYHTVCWYKKEATNGEINS